MDVNCKNRSQNFTSFIQVFGDYVGVYEEFTIKSDLQRIIIPIWLFLGIPGSIFCVIVWTRPQMLHTSSVYLAALGVSDLGFFLCLFVWFLKTTWAVDMLRAPVICEGFAVIFFFLQYLSPLFTFAFTVERYVLICLPFTGESFLNFPRAVKATFALAVGAISLSLIQGYFFEYDFETQKCIERKSVVVDGTWQNSLLFYWNLITETLVFGMIPLVILFLNILVIKETRHVQRNNRCKVKLVVDRETNRKANKNASTTVMILCVSFYFILSTIPVTITQLLTIHNFWIGDECLNVTEVLADPIWRNHFRVINVRSVIELIAQSHYAAKFYIYIITGQQFRLQFLELFNRTITLHYQMPSRRNGIELRQNQNTENQHPLLANNHPTQ